MKSFDILGVRVDFGLTVAEVLEIITTKLLPSKKSHLICTTNPEFVMDAQNDPEFKEIINGCSLSLPDGIGLIFAKHYLSAVARFPHDSLFWFRSFIYGLYLAFNSALFAKFGKERIPGVLLFHEICRLAVARNYSIFLLGGRGNVSAKAKERLLALYPGINIIGASSDFSRDSHDDVATVAYIQSCMKQAHVSHLDFLFVAYNHKYQEKWIVRNAHKVPALVSVGVGGTLDYVAKTKKESPEFMKKHGFEWLFRLITQPSRVLRILKAFPMFPLRVFASVASK